VAFPTHEHQVGSNYALNGERTMLRMQNGKTRAIASRPDHFRTFDIKTKLLTETESDEWDTHYDSIIESTDTFTFDSVAYTCRYISRPERLQVASDLFQVFARIREVA